MTTARRTALFALYCAGVAALGYVPLRALYEHSQRDNTASHVGLIPLISVALVWMQRDVVFRAVQASWRTGAVMVGIGVILLAASLTAWPDPHANLTVAVVPVVWLWISGFVLFFGTGAAHAALFPLLFLGFTAPVPPALLNVANDFLKDGSTEMVAMLFALTGTPHYRDEYVFRLPFVAIEVADACSGIRSSIGLMLTSLLAGYQLLDKGLNRALLLLAVVPITVFKNGVRIVTLSLLSVHVDPSYLDGQLHHEGGIVFFAISLGLLMPIVWLLARSEQRRGSSSGSGLRPQGAVSEAPAS